MGSQKRICGHETEDSGRIAMSILSRHLPRGHKWSRVNPCETEIASDIGHMAQKWLK